MKKHYSMFLLIAVLPLLMNGCFDAAGEQSQDSILSADSAESSIFGTTAAAKDTTKVLSSGQDRVITLSDGSYLVATGKDFSRTAGGISDISIVKVKADGTIAWGKLLGDSRLERNPRIVRKTDGGFTAAFEFKSTADQRFNIALASFNADGSVAWQKAYDQTDYDTIAALTQTADGGFLIVGQANLSTNKSWLIRTDALGTVTWQKNFPYDFTAAAAASDGTVYLTGSTVPLDTTIPVSGYWDLALVKLAADGTLIWSETLGASGKYSKGEGLEILTNGDIFVGGDVSIPVNSNADTYGDFFFARFTSAGSLVWQKTLAISATDERMQSIKLGTDGKILAAGYLRDPKSSNSYDIFAVKISTDGAVEWQKRYNYGSSDLAGEIALRADGGYMIGGTVLLNIKADGTFPYTPKKITAAATKGTIAAASLSLTPRTLSGTDAASNIFNPVFSLINLTVTATAL